ncbi:MAG: 6,7-dimethyl-8-ribityllumazine synthase, partial [Halothiobacillus sp. 20-53-49]
MSMTGITIVEGGLTAGLEGRYAICATRWNAFIVDRLVEGAIDTLKRHGVPASSITLVRVPGAYELPLIAQRVAAT